VIFDWLSIRDCWLAIYSRDFDFRIGQTVEDVIDHIP